MKKIWKKNEKLSLNWFIDFFALRSLTCARQIIEMIGADAGKRTKVQTIITFIFFFYLIKNTNRLRNERKIS